MKTLSIARASAFLASGSVAGAVVGFTYDSVVVMALGFGIATDAYFLALGLASFLPTLYFITATNVLTPSLAAGVASNRHSELVIWLLPGVVVGLGMALGRHPLATLLSSEPLVRQNLADALLVLAFIPVLAGVSEFRRARLLANGAYRISGAYVLLRNVATAGAALAIRPTSAAALSACLAIGYVGQALVVQLVRFPDAMPPVKRNDQTLGSSVAGPVVIGFLSQGLIFAIGYAPVLVERALAGRLGEGLPTVMSYSYRIVAMLGSVAITSATIPGVARLAGDLARNALQDVVSTLRELVGAAAALAVPAVLLLAALALPTGRLLSSPSAPRFALVLATYGLSLLPLIYFRSWSALQYARGNARRVLIVTAAQALATILTGMASLSAGFLFLALAPLVGGLVAVTTAVGVSTPEDRALLQKSLKLSGRWISSCLLAGALALLSGVGILALRSDREIGLMAGIVAVVVFGAVAWSTGAIRVARAGRDGRGVLA